ncbi:AAA family ATPase [Rhodobacter sphaeroides]|uniref:AAA family ATPase n=1 Tax=Cereibacter sphaeroides TaxID=1063 RepID=UPI001323237D|nr:ATP-binding protein [Cereibacter sphaeroides]MWP38291.1 AAA family ATPase [Cereibacter sphaeroides]
MLIEFSVQNHRAIRDKQTFSMAASATTQRAGHGHVLETGVAAIPFILSEACIFGANGAGKSSLINAMAAMKHFVRSSGKNSPGDRLLVKPFKFDSEWREKPSEFEVIFLKDETVYQYGFSLDANRVIEEWLFTRPRATGRERQIFSRTYLPDTGEYEWQLNSTHLKGERDSWKSQTTENSLFLSTAVRLNAKGLEPAYEWITKTWCLLDSAELQHQAAHTIDWLREGEKKQRVLDFLRSADIDLRDIELEEKDVPADVMNVIQAIFKSEGSDDVPDLGKMKVPDLTTVRNDNNAQPTPLPFSEESTGTKALFSLAAPVMSVLDAGRTLIVDELNTGLHPLAFQHLIGLFASKKSNPKGAQLIFTTHDTSVADQECLGRDQIWIVEKNKQLAAELVPLSDFRERDAKGFQKKYLDGRFGGIPRVEVKA